jgi:hypothetical protein
MSVLPGSVAGGPRMSARVLARMATTGIHLVRGVPRALQRSARARALRERKVTGVRSMTDPIDGRARITGEVFPCREGRKP